MGRQLDSYDIVFIFHPKSMVHLLESSYLCVWSAGIFYL